MFELCVKLFVGPLPRHTCMTVAVEVMLLSPLVLLRYVLKGLFELTVQPTLLLLFSKFCNAPSVAKELTL